MNSMNTTGFREDAHSSLVPVAGCMIVAGCLLVLLCSELGPHVKALYVLALLLVAVGFASFYLEMHNYRFAPHVMIFGLVTIIALAQTWLNESTFLLALFFPTALAAALINIRTTFVLAGLESGLVVALTILTPLNVTPLIAIQTAVSIWAIAGVMAEVYLPIYQLLGWVWGQYQFVQQTLEEIRSQRAASLQVLNDLEHANHQLALTGKRMADLRAVAEEAQQSKASFVAKVSHEFRTPLNIIIGLINLLMEANAAGSHQAQTILLNDLKVIHRNCAHLSDLVNDVLDLSRAEVGQLTLQKEWVDLRSIIESAGDIVKPLIEKKRLEFIINLQQELPLVYCDRVRIRQVLLNLVGNAARFTDVGRITIEAHQHEGNIEVNINDTGPGIKPEDRERIFEPFCQGTDNLWRDKGGTGLGLSISKQFIELHNGRLTLETELGLGTTFSVILPISPVSEPIESMMRWIHEEWPWHEHSHRSMQLDRATGPRIVIYDQIGSLERSLSGYQDTIEIVFTKSMAELTNELQSAPAHALLVNSESPENLWQLVEQVRTMIPDTPITGCCVPSDNLHRAREYGVLHYLTKPVTRERLLEVILGLEIRPRRILIVDDDPDMRWLLARSLEVESDVEIATAENGVDALEELHFQLPDLILLDIAMPGMDGWEMLKLKAHDPVIAPIPVILISGYDALLSPPSSQSILMTFGSGISLDKLLRLSLQHSAVIQGLDRQNDSTQGG